MPLNRISGVRAFAVIAALSLLACALPATSAYKFTPDDHKKLMPLKEVRPGMQGVGRTVFRGTKIEQFAIKVIGVLPDMNAGKSLILIRMQGGPITSRQANIVGGMSGSPIYVNGRIIGAVAYGAIFPKEPLALVTPIEDMLDSWDPNLPAQPAGGAGGGAEFAPVSVNGRSFTKVKILAPNDEPTPGGSGELVMTPLMNPLSVSGLSAKNMEKLRNILLPYSVAATPGPGPITGKNKTKVTLQPGSSVGMSLASGDVDLTFIGTLTYRQGNKVVAFGHPALAIGPIDAPMTTAYVHEIFPSLMSSMKLASPIETVGSISQDRQFSIGGQVGKLPKMIPVTVFVNDTSAKRSKTFNIKVINHPLLAPLFIALVADESINRIHGAPGEAMARVSLEVKTSEVGTIKRENTVFNPVFISSGALDDLTELLFTLRANRFHPVDVQSVKLAVDIAAKRNTATIERVFVKGGKYKPGDTIDVGVVLRPYKADRITKYVKVPIPPSTPNGRATLTVRGGSSRGGASMSSGPDGGSEEESAPPSQAPDIVLTDNVSQIVKKFLEREKNNEIVAKLAFSGSAVNVAGEKLSYLPSHLAEVMKSPRGGSQRTEREEIKAVQATDYVLSGARTLSITIQKKDVSEKKAAPQRGEPSGSPPESSGPPPDSSPGSPASMDEVDFFDASAEELIPEANGIPGVVFRPSPEVVQRVKEAAARNAARRPTPPAPSASSAPSSKDEKPIGRAATTWTQTSRLDFNSGDLIGVSATTGDDLRLSAPIEPFAGGADQYVWSLASDGAGGVYAGSGNNGMVYRFSADGKVSPAYKTSELEVLSLVRDPAGQIYAGTSPNGIVYRIMTDGKAAKLFDAPEKHIAALVADKSGNIYAATGDKSRVYRIEPDGKSKEYFSSPDQNAQALAIDQAGNVYIGTAPNGIVYKVAPDGSWTTLYDAAENSITAIAVDTSGNVFAAVNPKPAIIKIPASGAPKVILDKASSTIMSMAVDSSGNVLAQSQDRIYRIQPDEIISEMDAKDDVMFVSMALDESGRVFVGTANPGEVYATPSKAVTGVYESVARDTKSTSQWGVISWNAVVPQGAKVTLKTRTGNSSEPDDTWSAWSSEYATSGAKIISQPARYIQYRAELTSGENDKTPELKDVSAVYMTANQPPTVKISSPIGGEKWSKKQTVKWSGTDPDKDVLTYDLYVSSDGGAHWRPLKKGSKAPAEAAEPVKGSAKAPTEEKKPPKIETPAPETPAARDESSSAEDDEDISEEDFEAMMAAIDAGPYQARNLKKRVMAEAASSKAPEEKIANGVNSKPTLAEAAAKIADKTAESQKAESTKDTSYAWDTASFPDGVYMIKIVASDKTSNPSGALTAEKISDQFVLANKPPKLTLFKKTITVLTDKSVKLEALAWQKAVSVTNAQYRVDSGEWTAAGASDGIFDSGLEPIEITTQPLSKGDHTIEVQAFDAAGNNVSRKASVKVE